MVIPCSPLFPDKSVQVFTEMGQQETSKKKTVKTK